MVEKTRYAKLVSVPEHPELLDIELFCDAEGKRRTRGKIEVPPEGATVYFRPIDAQLGSWQFHSLTIHPLFSELLNPLDLRWTVYPTFVVLNHSNPVPGRHFSYTLSIDVGPCRVYLDPQMVDTGGGSTDIEGCD